VGKFVNNNNKTTKMKKITEELPGSQRWVTKKIGDPKIKKSARKLIRKMSRKGRLVQVNKLYINVQDLCEGNVYLTLNILNKYTGEIKSINVNSPGNIVGKEIKI
jgi:hypothetical protein